MLFIYSLKIKIYSSSRYMYLIALQRLVRNIDYIAEQCNLCFYEALFALEQSKAYSFFCWRHETWIPLLCNGIHVSDSHEVLCQGPPCGDNFIYSLKIKIFFDDFYLFFRILRNLLEYALSRVQSTLKALQG